MRTDKYEWQTDQSRNCSLLTTDWNEEWIAARSRQGKIDSPQHWDSYADTFARSNRSDYTDQFLHLAAIGSQSSVFDMGCGTGNLAIPLALNGCPVIAADFSQNMIEHARNFAQQAKADSATFKVMSWSDDWSACGVEEKSVDVAIASRSIATDDLKAAILKLNQVARQRCCITLSTGPSTRSDPRILKALGVAPKPRREFQYAWNILANEGLEPTCDYIRSARNDVYDSPDAAFASLSRMIDDVVDLHDQCRSAIMHKLQLWLEDNLIACEANADDAHAYKLKQPRIITWAFISWDAR